MSQPQPPHYPSPYPQQGWSDPRAAVPEQTHLGGWAPQPAASPYGAPQHGGYPQPPYGHGPREPQQNNAMGITALVLALVGLLLCWIPFVGLLSVLLGALAIVFGLVGWNRARHGRAGLVLPVVGAAIGIVAIVVGVLSTALVARFIGSAGDVPADPPAASDVPAVSDGTAPGDPGLLVDVPDGEQVTADGTLPTPGTYTWDDGLSVRVAAPGPAQFSDTACCPEGSTTGVAFEVTIVNGTSEVIEPFALLATLTADGRDAPQVFDVDQGYDGVTASIPPGRELVVTMAFEAPGGDLLLELSSFDRESAFFTATL